MKKVRPCCDYLNSPRAVGYPMTSSNPLQVPVVICEFHQEVLEFIHRHIARKKLPFSNLLMLHFDSHPDLAFPQTLFADDCKSKEKMYNDLEICDWILPLAYMKHLNRLVWMKPDWSKQIGNINTKFFVGKEKISGKLKVSCAEDYFIEDCTYASAKNLIETNELQFDVVTIPSNVKLFDTHNKDVEKSAISHDVTTDNDRLTTDDDVGLMSKNAIFKNTSTKTKTLCEAHSKKSRVSAIDILLSTMKREKTLTLPKQDEKWILDIDLDFFSVNNPFMKEYTKEEFSLLKEIYDMEIPRDKMNEHDLKKHIENREKHAHLKEQIYLFSKGIDMGNNLKLIKLLSMIKTRVETKEDFDWLLVHDAGLSCNVPDHVSSDQEIDVLIHNTMLLLRELPAPALVTIARSTEDEYCPPEQAEFIQKKVVNMLRILYGDIIVTYDYKDSARLD